MVKTLTLRGLSNLITNYKVKKISKKQKMLEYDRMYEEYICEGIRKSEEDTANGAKVYSEEEFWNEMRRCYGINI